MQKILIVLICLGLLSGGVVWASTQQFDVAWWTVDGGGGTSTDGRFAISGTIGQGDAGTAVSNERYTISGGFWQLENTAPSEKIYLPIARRT